MPVYIDFDADTADADANAVTPSRNTRSISSSPGRSLLKFDWQAINVTQITIEFI